MIAFGNKSRICKKCTEELFPGENCFGDTKDMQHICISCFEQMTPAERKGVVPVSCIITKEWQEYVAKFGLVT